LKHSLTSRKPSYEELQSRFRHLEREAEAALREHEKRYRSLFEDSRDAIYITTKDGKFLDANQALLDLFGYSREEVLNRINVKETYRSLADRERFQQEVEAKGSVRDFEVVLRKKDGSEMDCLLTSSVRRSLKGDILGYQGIIRDITERKQMEEALKESSEKIKRFAYSISHDLKSPAIGIFGLTRRLHQNYAHLLDEKGKSTCDHVLKTAEQIATLAEQIMVYISSKENPLTIESIDLKQATQTIREEFSARLSVRGIRWVEPEDLPAIRCDRLCMLRVLRNLVDNALKYGGDDLSRLTVGYAESEESHVLSLTNNGAVIDGAAAERIFQPFHRSESSRGMTGVGLGLAIVQELAERHGGTVWVRSSPDEGTTFFISIARVL